MSSPIVFLQEDQIIELIRHTREGAIHHGVGFEFPGESVFHVFTKYPKVPPSGIPIPVKIVIGAPSCDFKENADNIAPRHLKLSFSKLNSLLTKSCFLHDGRDAVLCDIQFIPKTSELYSRSKGLLETDVLSQKRVVIIGVGSFGSTIAVELSKAGIGAFSLYDFDRLELSNVSRHASGISDLGRFKTHAVRDAIWNRNPFCDVKTSETDINNNLTGLEMDCSRSDLIICVTDEHRSRSNTNVISLKTRKTALFGRAITRAAGGDVFRLRPNLGPCLACIEGRGLYRAHEEISNKRQARRNAAAYVSDERASATIQVGLASDIAPITNMVVKLALVELSRDLPSGISSLESDLISDFYIWANRRDVIYNAWPPMEHYFNRNSVLRWYGVRAPRDPDCLQCGRH